MTVTEKNNDLLIGNLFSAISSYGKAKFGIHLFLIFNCIIIASNCFSQSRDFFVRHGNNIASVTCGEMIFAPLTTAENRTTKGAGAVWIKKPIDLRQPFDISFVTEFNSLIGTDGGAFVLTADSASVGNSNDGLGFEGINKSVAVTFDPVINSEDNDPSFVHIAIQANGDVNHSSINNLAGPVSFESLYQNISGVRRFSHIIKISWDPVARSLTAYIEGVKYVSAQYDLIQKIFDGNPNVYFGFTASNTQLQYFPPRAEIEFGYIRFSFGTVVPKYSASPEPDTCFGKPITFSDNSTYFSENIYSNTDQFKWYWDFGDGTKFNGKDPPPHYYPGPGSYKFQYTVTNQIGCTSDTFHRLITLGSPPVADFSNTPACSNSVTSFLDMSTSMVGAPVVWEWDFDNNGMKGNKMNDNTVYSRSGTRAVSVKIRTEYGCEATITKTITVAERPSVNFSYQKDCEGNVQFTSLVQNNLPIDAWHWDFNDHTGSFDKDPSHFFFRNGIYQTALFAVSDKGCVSDTITKPILINKIYPFAGNDTIIAVGQPFQLHALGGGTYSWSPSEGLSNVAIADPVVKLDHDQAYYLTITNSAGCIASDTIRIKVYDSVAVYVPNAFTPNHDGLNDVLHAIAPGYTVNYFAVYDRHGKLVFQTHDANAGWDGNFNGTPQYEGAYVWLVKATNYRGYSVVKKGSVILVR
ncbi:gliding motility-associated C-terminal domain-containing protein [Ferruginibacter lapsinanis]|uniref:PKD domain-containing protein n=1 Tax=Ferruginibacter lapsinanis TaxID=563172 RepID=UPI001E2C0491|nr:PKD domain-containing protein [Ferruginibacter lapsinanis]UEG51124.1 gliding motility-associated C-terminal domain-containing protein [Ferruginibacter lapsinanis]